MGKLLSHLSISCIDWCRHWTNGKICLPFVQDLKLTKNLNFPSACKHFPQFSHLTKDHLTALLGVTLLCEWPQTESNSISGWVILRTNPEHLHPHIDLSTRGTSDSSGKKRMPECHRWTLIIGAAAVNEGKVFATRAKTSRSRYGSWERAAAPFDP